MNQIYANLVHREQRYATFEGDKIPSSIRMPNSANIKLDLARPSLPAPTAAAGRGRGWEGEAGTRDHFVLMRHRPEGNGPAYLRRQGPLCITISIMKSTAADVYLCTAAGIRLFLEVLFIFF